MQFASIKLCIFLSHVGILTGDFYGFLPWQVTELVGYNFVSPKASWRPCGKDLAAKKWIFCSGIMIGSQIDVSLMS